MFAVVVAVVATVALLGSVCGILLLRDGRAGVGRVVLLSVFLPFALILANAVASGDWFMTVFAVMGLMVAAVAWVGIPKVVSPS